jgi:hypothetical protein
VLTYIFLAIFIAIFTLSFFRLKNNRYPSLVMVIGYVFYIFFILPLVYKIIYPVNAFDAGRIYFILLSVLDVTIGLVMLKISKSIKSEVAKIIGFLSIFSAINHIYGRIGYQYRWDNLIYHNISISITITIIILMIAPKITLRVWGLIHGLSIVLSRRINRANYILYNNSYLSEYFSKKENEVKKGKVEKC